MVTPTGGRTVAEQTARDTAIAAGKAQRAADVAREARITAKGTTAEFTARAEALAKVPTPAVAPEPTPATQKTPEMTFDAETGKTFNVTEPAKPVEVHAVTGLPLDRNAPRYNEIFRQVANQAAKQAIPMPITDAVKKFADDYGMSNKAAARTVAGIAASGGHAAEFRNLASAEISDAQSAADKSIKEYNIEVQRHNKALAEAQAAQKKAKKTAALYEGWTAKELTTGKVVDGTFTPGPWGEKGGVYTPPPKAVQAALAKDERAIEAAAQLLIENKPLPDPLKEAAANQMKISGMAIAGIAGEMALYMIPVYGTYLQFKDSMADGKINGGEAAWLAASVGFDILFFTGIGGAVGLAARGTAGLSAAARVAAASRAAGKMVLMEVTAPYQVIRHPIRTATGAIKTVENIIRPSKIPLAAVEVSHATVRLPVKAFAGESEAMNVRDITTLAAMQEGKFVSNVGGIQVNLTPARLQRVGDPIAVHTSPDIRPFMEGATLSAGREGGLFVSPNIHTRFSTASAFGDMPEGGIRGALIIRDEALLEQLGGSGKIYNKTVEIEALLKGGVKLPKPSQTLITRTPGADTSAMLKEAKKLREAGKIDDATALEQKAAALKKQGDKMTLLVYGKPYSAAELAELKVMGALDNVTQIFTPPAGIKGAKLAAGYDELNDVRQEANALIIEANKLKRGGKVTEAAAAERKANELIVRATRLAQRMSAPTGSYAGPMRMAIANTGAYSPMERLERLQGSERPELNITREQLNRLREDTRTSKTRAAVDRGIERVRVDYDRLKPPPRVPTLERPPRVPREPRPPERPPRVPREPRPPERPPRVPREPRPPERPPRVPREPRPPERPPRVPREPRPPERPPRVPPRVPPPPPPPPPGGTDKEDRQRIRKSGGAVGWRQGELHGKSVWNVFMHPYTSKEDFVTVVGRKPKNTTIVTGPKSAYETITLIHGKPPARRVSVDIGFMDAFLEPKGGKQIGIGFKPDPKGLTTGDITIGISKGKPSITERPPRLSGRSKVRITPKRPALRR